MISAELSTTLFRAAFIFWALLALGGIGLYIFSAYLIGTWLHRRLK